MGSGKQIVILLFLSITAAVSTYAAFKYNAWYLVGAGASIGIYYLIKEKPINKPIKAVEHLLYLASRTSWGREHGLESPDQMMPRSWVPILHYSSLTLGGIYWEVQITKPIGEFMTVLLNPVSSDYVPDEDLTQHPIMAVFDDEFRSPGQIRRWARREYNPQTPAALIAQLRKQYGDELFDKLTGKQSLFDVTKNLFKSQR
jgi:hypothetical protein